MLDAEALCREVKAGRPVAPSNDSNQQSEQHHQGSTEFPVAIAQQPKAETAEKGHLENSFAQLSLADAQDASRSGSSNKIEAISGSINGHSGATEATAATKQGLLDTAATADPTQKPSDLMAAKTDVKHQSQHDSPAAANPGEATSEDVAKVALWHRPEVWVWAEIQDVAVRVIMTLHWTRAWFRSSSQDFQSPKRVATLQVHLLHLLHDLLIGHFEDQGMDFTPVLSIGLLPVLRCGCLAATESPSLGLLIVAFLQRTAQGAQAWGEMEGYERPKDEIPGFQEMEVIWQLFGKHQAATD